MAQLLIALAALIIAAGTAIYGVKSGNRKANLDYVTQLERRLEKLEDELKDCLRTGENLRLEYVTLLRELTQAKIRSP